MTFGTRPRSAATSRSWSGCSASTLPVQPINRVVVSLPAEAMLLTYTEDLGPREAAPFAVLVLELGLEHLRS